MNSNQPRRCFGWVLLLIHKAFTHAKRDTNVKRNRKMIALVVILVVVLVVVPAIAMIAAAVIHVRWKADHPEQTLVPHIEGTDRAAAETAVRNAQLRPRISFEDISDRCWQDPPQPNTVLLQTPGPFTPVAIETEVSIVVGVTGKPKPAMDRRGLKPYDLDDLPLSTVARAFYILFTANLAGIDEAWPPCIRIADYRHEIEAAWTKKEIPSFLATHCSNWFIYQAAGSDVQTTPFHAN